jgi:uncharacterized membrane protein
MKQLPKLFLLIFLLGNLFLFAQPVFADKYGISDTANQTNGLLPTSIGGARTVPQLIGVIIQIILSFLAIIFFLLIFYAGLIWMTARGNTENITKAKGIMEGAVIGLIIVMASYAISRFIFQSITTGKADLGAPTSPVNCESITDETTCTKSVCAYDSNNKKCFTP